MEASLAIVYVTLFRLSIIGVGAVSIWLGYRLFVKGIYAAGGGGGAELGAKVGETELTLKNAAPGTFFALFGVIVISVMLINSPPEVIKKQSPVKGGEDEEQTKASTWIVRGSKEDSVDLLKLAAWLNDLAWERHAAGALPEAVLVSRMSVHLASDNANFMDTLASMLYATEQFDDALEYKRHAARLDESFADDLAKYEEATR